MERVISWEHGLLALALDALLLWFVIRMGLKVGDVPFCLLKALQGVWAWLLRRVR